MAISLNTHVANPLVDQTIVVYFQASIFSNAEVVLEVNDAEIKNKSASLIVIAFS